MNQETKLKLQAYFDNELSERESREIAAWLERDSDAQALLGELHEVTRLLEGNELEVKVPDSREFYWSKIQRAIDRNAATEEETEKVSEAPLSRWWIRVFAPALGVAMLLVTALSFVKFSNTPARHSYLHEIETPLEDTSAISFHSQASGMTVVWVQSRVY